MNVEAIILYILLIDAISAKAMVQFGSEWYVHNFRTLSRWFRGLGALLPGAHLVGRLAPLPRRQAVFILRSEQHDRSRLLTGGTMS